MDGRKIQELSDAELDAYILARLRAADVDLGVLPEDDPAAPSDRRRILEGARRFLRSTPPAILAFEPDVQRVAPEMYPAARSAGIGPEERDG
ncbi:MAG TPA: hypothetical protein VK849_11865 [Longimicrobiales bacterium]|nr:hypothetical protein [Longimicrobiales bacterium]